MPDSQEGFRDGPDIEVKDAFVSQLGILLHEEEGEPVGVSLWWEL